MEPKLIQRAAYRRSERCGRIVFYGRSTGDVARAKALDATTSCFGDCRFTPARQPLPRSGTRNLLHKLLTEIRCASWLPNSWFR